jgi:hypothetical protein
LLPVDNKMIRNDDMPASNFRQVGSSPLYENLALAVAFRSSREIRPIAKSCRVRSADHLLGSVWLPLQRITLVLRTEKGDRHTARKRNSWCGQFIQGREPVPFFLAL